jgi:prolyl-tRNA synthetase
MVRTPAGEDQIVSCDGCNYAANMEKATSKLDRVDDLAAEGDGRPLEVHTPGRKTIEDVARFLGVSPKNKIKTLALMTKIQHVDSTGKVNAERPVVVFLRGDHMLNEAKLKAVLKAADVRPMLDGEIQALFKSPAGYLGPLGIKPASAREFAEWCGPLPGVFPGEPNKDVVYAGGDPKSLKDPRDTTLPFVLVDKALEGRSNLIAGANKEDYHLKNLTPGKDFHPTAYADLRAVTAGEGCPNCGNSLRIDTAVEIGHIFKLGYRYSDAMGAHVLDKNGKEVTPIMGSYGIGIERILTAAVEQSNDENGFWLAPAIAPFEIVVTPVNVKDENLLKAAVDIGTRLEAAGFDVILDDRNERPGVKFKDADLVGIPFRITVGNKVTEGTVEVVLRSTREVRDVTIAAVVEYFQGVLRARA